MSKKTGTNFEYVNQDNNKSASKQAQMEKTEQME